MMKNPRIHKNILLRISRSFSFFLGGCNWKEITSFLGLISGTNYFTLRQEKMSINIFQRLLKKIYETYERILPAQDTLIHIFRK